MDDARKHHRTIKKEARDGMEITVNRINIIQEKFGKIKLNRSTKLDNESYKKSIEYIISVYLLTQPLRE